MIEILSTNEEDRCFRIDELFQPRTIAEAAELLEKYSDITVLGGCGFLKLGNRRVAKAIDLSRCDLHSIREAEQKIEIGAMVTLRDIETYPGFLRLFTGALPKATGNIMGVQFRRSATVGASVYSKYGFSDLIPVLLALKTEVELLRGGRMQLDDFLEKPLSRDILIRLFITKDERRVSYQNMRNSRTDFPIVNAAVSRVGNDWRVVVGARRPERNLRYLEQNSFRKHRQNRYLMLKRLRRQLLTKSRLAITTRLLPTTGGRCAGCW